MILATVVDMCRDLILHEFRLIAIPHCLLPQYVLACDAVANDASVRHKCFRAHSEDIRWSIARKDRDA
jgi:hypothetical protein